MKFSVIIPTYNHCDDLLKPCVEAIIKYTNLEDIELIIVANGCYDETKEYLTYLESYFSRTNIGAFKSLYFEAPLGYSKANNAAIRVATTDKLILLNNDAFLLGQDKSTWLRMLDGPFQRDPNCGISYVLKAFSDCAGHDFAVFFCVIVHRKVFDKLGTLLNEEYGKGGGEDTELCIEAQRAGFTMLQCGEQTWSSSIGMNTGAFPIYHKGEGTVHDKSLVPDWNDVFARNSLKLAKKYNPQWYRYKLTNSYERSVILKGDMIHGAELTRYLYAKQNILGSKILEIGCSSGYGSSFFPDADYTGIDYDPVIIEVATEQNWSPTAKFHWADINNYVFDQYDTIIAFEVIEHLDNGLEVAEMLKKHCKRLLLTVPHEEPPGFFGGHHKLHKLNESHLPGFEYSYISCGNSQVTDTLTPISDQNPFNLLLCKWTKPE